MNSGLIIIDMQKDYFKGGKNELVNAEAAAKKAKKLIDLFRAKGKPVIFIQHVNLNEKSVFAKGSTGVEISEIVKPLSQEIVIEKHYPDSFYQTTLLEQLKKMNITKLVVCGMMTHMCVDTTVRAAKNYGFDSILIEDACATKNLRWKDIELQADLVQKVYMASLQGSFSSVISEEEYEKLCEESC